jgi:hypothetical protein
MLAKNSIFKTEYNVPAGTVSSKKKKNDEIFVFTSLKSLKKEVGSICKRYRPADPDLHQNVTDPQHWFLRTVGREFMVFLRPGDVAEDPGGGERENSTSAFRRELMLLVRLGHVAEDPGGGEAHPLLRRAPRLREDQGEDDGGGQEQLRSEIQILMSETHIKRQATRHDCLPSLLGDGTNELK